MEAGRAEGPSPSFSNMRVRCCDLPSMVCMLWVLLRMAGKLKQRYMCGRSEALQAGGGMQRPHWPLSSNLARHSDLAARHSLQVYGLQEEDWNQSALSIVVVGASGDLAKKKIFPALFALYYENMLPKVGGAGLGWAGGWAAGGWAGCGWVSWELARPGCRTPCSGVCNACWGPCQQTAQVRLPLCRRRTSLCTATRGPR